MKKLLISLFLVLGLGILAGYGIGWLLQQTQEEDEVLPRIVEDLLPPHEAVLYFADSGGRYLVRRIEQIDGCEDDRECIRALLARLIAGPESDLIRVLPPTTRILGVELENDLVYVDFSRHLVDHHPGGTLSELLTVHSLVSSLSESFPYIRRLQILVESEMLRTLKGHVRIDHPVYAEYALTQPPALDGSVGTTSPAAAKELDIEQIINEATKNR